MNLGTPSSPHIKDVRRYLHEFLLDPRVIDIPRWKRELLVRFVIVPKRIRETTLSYKKVWTEEGSPLLYWGKKVRNDLEERLGSEFIVKLAMRYQTPNIKETLKMLSGCLHLIVIPLFPQYASATTGSIFSLIMKELKFWNTIPTLHMLSSYPTDSYMIEAFANRARAMNYQKYERIIFSFHGLPVRHLVKCDTLGVCQKVNECCIKSLNPKCYAAECFMTANAIAKALEIPKTHFQVTFQSRLGKEPWLEPSTQETVRKLALNGTKSVLVFSPSFVADCLETIFEIGEELKNEFCHLGGETLELVPSLNDHPLWITSLENHVRTFSRKKIDSQTDHKPYDKAEPVCRTK